jgi:hypothetical protein
MEIGHDDLDHYVDIPAEGVRDKDLLFPNNFKALVNSFYVLCNLIL